MTENDKKVLRVLIGEGEADFCFRNFDTIARDSGLSRVEVRNACRSLKVRGLATFGRPLFDEDGKFSGSGYAATDAGCAARDSS